MLQVAELLESSVAEREAKSQSTQVDVPKRLIVMFTHYGCLTNRWFPAKSHGELKAEDYQATTLKHLAEFAPKLLVPRGIRAMNEWSFSGTYGQTTDPHTQVCGSFFSCYPVTPDDGKFNAKSTGRTLDHVAAEQVSPGGSPLFMQIGIGNPGMGGECLAGVLEMIATIDDWYAQQFAYLVKRLDSFDEGEVKLLDNTATVWFQELSDGNSHNLNNLPILQAGSCGGYFRTGWAVNVEDGSPSTTTGHSEEDCKNGQSPIGSLDNLGTPPDVATQPINKYFCNLMNAIGVKGGADGFPLKDGPAEVSCFGKYDDTRLFKGGGTAPTTIGDPGEFSELRANG